ncbi:tetratricopeptide repeat protein [Pseudomonadota bacterium]
MTSGTFYSELRKRKVLQAAAIYGAVAWGVTEVVVTVVEQLFLPQWVSTLAVIGFVVGFPVAMFLSWTFDLTSGGMQRTTVSSRRGKASIATSIVLLVAGTAGLFFLIKPALQSREAHTERFTIIPNSIAVLPFENTGPASGDIYLSQGLSDELRDQLGRVPGLRIAARSSSVAVRELGIDAKAGSVKLSVANLVEGSLRRKGNKLYVSVQLIEGNSGLALWSEIYERGPAELVSLQQEIATQVVQHILPETPDLVFATATRNATANELMLLARYYEQQVLDRQEVDQEKLLEAIRLYREATEADPESALAHSRLAGALLYLGDLEAAEAPVFRALALDPKLSEVHQTLGLYYFARGMPEANAAFRRAVDLNPNNADALEHYAFTLWIQGIDENVAELYQLALDLDPLSLSRYAALGQLLGKQGRSKDVYAVIQRVDELFKGAEAKRLISRLLELTGDLDKAIAWAIRARDLEPENPDHNEWLAELYTEIGDLDTALSLEPNPGIGLLFMLRRYHELIDMAEELMIDEPEDVVVRYFLAFAYNAVGQYESAIWILSSTGLPETVMEMPRMSADWDGFIALINASMGAGETEVAKGLAAWFVNDDSHHQNPDWYADTYIACAMATIEQDKEALQKLKYIRQSPRLAWPSVLKDSLCFKRFASEPIFQETLQQFDARRASLRKRLPVTLEEFGVEL